MKDTILLIEDEALLAEELARHFRRGGWLTWPDRGYKAAAGPDFRPSPAKRGLASRGEVA